MKRRNFATLMTVAFSAATGMKSTAAGGKKNAEKQFYELRRYLLDSAEKQQALEAFLRDVEIPALNRQGIKPIGVFKEMEGESLTIHMLIPHPSLESFSTFSDRLAADKKYMTDGDSILNTDKKNAPFLRIESSLMKAFNRMPQVVVPDKVEGRVYELRQYESACFVAGKSKVEMFDSAGEIEIFLETDINPVFFGETLIGSKVPNLTYMISFKDMAEHDASWDKFKVHPEWERLRGIEKFKGNVSNITRTFLKAVPYSQI